MQRLSAALADRYTIEREPGAERFVVEIKTTARTRSTLSVRSLGGSIQMCRPTPGAGDESCHWPDGAVDLPHRV